ncbi:uncharacterized protein V2V93DRAFT_367809 [Kockiozyma suomiensis]|uniref:uncharacterized protein n=1 Tax=Kockiozyma suomiensis TaxID=1337062 RepID=UPI003343D749
MPGLLSLRRALVRTSRFLLRRGLPREPPKEKVDEPESSTNAGGASVSFRVFQGAVMALFANMVGQYLVARRDRKLHKFQFDLVPIVQFVCWTIAITPVMIRWQDILDHFFPSQIVTHTSVSSQRSSAPVPSSSAIDIEKRQAPSPAVVRSVKYSHQNILIKTILSETLFALTANGIFLFYMSILRDYSPAKAVSVVERDLPTVWINSIKFWPVVSYITLGFIPVDYRIAFSSIFAAIWSVYISMVTL